MNGKYNEAIGLFWAASLFIGALVAVIIGFCGNVRFNLLFAVVIGICVFLTLGLVSQGLVSLLKKDNEDKGNKANE